MEPMLKDRLTHHINDEVTTNAFMGDVLYQLARYEDTGFSVEELESLREKKLQKSVSVLHATAESYEENGKEQIDGTLDQISRQMAIEALNREYLSGATVNMCGLEVAMDVIEELPSAQPEIQFLDFLWNAINPNDMEKYLSMYHSKEEKRNGRIDQQAECD